MDARDPVSAVVDFAFDAARRRGARLHAVHAWRLPSRAERWMPYALPEEDRGRIEDQKSGSGTRCGRGGRSIRRWTSTRTSAC